MNSVLALKGVSKSYYEGKPNEINVLSGVDFSLDTGEVVGLVAPSGAGKSTLLQIAGLLDTPTAGQIIIAGNAVEKAKDKERTRLRRQQIGFVYQFHHLLPEFSAQENIVLPQLANGVAASAAKARAQMLLESVGLAARQYHRPAELSGGEQQRVAFCRALANEPALLLADEPTGNLDPETSQTVFETLMKLVRETGLSALIATHNYELAARMDRVVRLTGGQIEAA